LSSDEVRQRAEKSFKQQERALDGRKAMTEYEAQALAIREKTAHLRALRLAKEAQAQLCQGRDRQGRVRGEAQAARPVTPEEGLLPVVI